MPRRVLLLTYYFPPSGGPGVQRMLKTVKYLPELGWTPDVLTVGAGAYPEHDASLTAEVPPDATVHRTRALEPFRWYERFVGANDDKAVVGSVADQGTNWKQRLALWIRANVFLPDARVGWVPFAVKKGLHLLRRRMEYDAVLTSGPPHSVHLTGRILQKCTGVPWVADFRDPWTDINYYDELPHTRWARRLDRAMEQSVLRNAALVTTVSPHWKQRLRRKAPASRARFEVIHNGFDEDDFTTGAALKTDKHFLVRYVGSLYASRNPSTLWRALAKLKRKEATPKLRVQLVGRVTPIVRRTISEYDLDEWVDCVPYVPHREAVRLMQQSALLLLVIEDFPAAPGMITGKLYEYLASGRPVLGIGPPEGDAAALLEDLKAGRLFGRTETRDVVRFLQRHYDAWASGSNEAGASSKDVAPYSRKAQTKTLASTLELLN